MRKFAIPLILVASACSGQSTNNGRASADAMRGPQGPQPAGTNNPVPRDSPYYCVTNVPATEGRVNVSSTPPPFDTKEMGTFSEPFSLAFLPDGALLVTEKAGQLKLRGGDGRVSVIAGVPAVARGGQGGLLDVAPEPGFAQNHQLYFSYAEPRPYGGSSLALARAALDRAGSKLGRVEVIWRAGSDGPGGQFGSIITFAPDGKTLYLSSGERQRFAPAQDPDQALGKIMHLTLDGKPAAGNPMADAGGVKAATWSTGHRNPYGMVFTPDGRLWEEEMGPRGGDELNLILPGRNYGWPIVSNGDNYSGVPIPDHPSRPDLEAPKLWWNPSISPGGMIYYSGAMFPAWRGSLLIAALSGEAIIRVALDGDKATLAAQWAVGLRVRDLALAGQLREQVVERRVTLACLQPEGLGAVAVADRFGVDRGAAQCIGDVARRRVRRPAVEREHLG